MKNKIFILFFILLIANVKAQDSIQLRKNKVSIELLGSCIFFSFNYERVLKTFKKFEFSAEVGYCFLHTNRTFEGCQFPVHLNFVYTKYRVKPEIDLGITNIIHYPPNPKATVDEIFYGMPPPPQYFVEYTPRIGIRYNFSKNIFGKLMFIPLVQHINYGVFNNKKYTQTSLFPWIGLNFGINLK